MFKFKNSQVFKNIRNFFNIILLVIGLFLIIPFTLGHKPIQRNLLKDENSYLLEIPAISLKEKLCNVRKDTCLKRGVWLKSFDLEYKNFLLTGHSFFVYPLKAGVFYNLGDVTLGDSIYLNFGEDKYVYEVVNISVHERYDLSVEGFEDNVGVLRIYTCYPVWSNLKRLVIEARRVNH